MLLLAVILSLTQQAQAVSAQAVSDARVLGIKWLLENQNADGSWGNKNDAKVILSATALEALRHAGVSGFSYARGVAWLSNAQAHSVDARARRLLALARAGVDVSIARNELFAAAVFFHIFSSDTGWGEYSGQQPTVSNTLIALGAIGSVHFEAQPFLLSGAQAGILNRALNLLLRFKTTIGAFSESRPLCSLTTSVYTATCAEPSASLYENAVALKWLRDLKTHGLLLQPFFDAPLNFVVGQQHADGSFGPPFNGNQGNIVDTALALQGIAAEKSHAHAAVQAGLDYLVPQQQADGQWSAGVYPTASVLLAMPEMILTDTDADGLPDAVETLIPQQDPAVADAREWFTGHGNPSPGDSVVIELLLGQQHAAVNQQLIADNGPAVAWRILYGALPTGTTLDTAQGVLTGQPEENGIFDVLIEIEYQTGTKETRLLRLEVAPATEIIPTLPVIAMLLLAAMMVALNRLRGRRDRTRWISHRSGRTTQ